MWSPHGTGQDFPPWMSGGMDFDATSPAMGAFGPMTPSTSAYAANDAQHAMWQAQQMKSIVQEMTQRVQKLERSRGQITKDISDMLQETREMMKHVGIEVPVKKEKAAPPPVTPIAPTTPVTPASVKAERLVPPPGLAMPLPESLTVTSKEIEGKQVARVEWLIDNVRAKFKDCVGRPLVSPPFEAGGLTDCRLMVSPNIGVDISGLSMREQKAKYEAKIAEGPLSGDVKFKVVSGVGDVLNIKFQLFVGSMSKGPLQHDFAEHIIHGTEFASNWLDELQGTSLIVGVEVLEVEKKG